MIGTLAAGRGWLRQRRWIILWSLVSFLFLAKYDRFASSYINNLDSWQASRTALAQIQTKDGVLTTNSLGAQISQRPFINLFVITTKPATVPTIPDETLAKVNYALFDFNLSKRKQASLQRSMSQIEAASAISVELQNETKLFCSLVKTVRHKDSTQ